MCILRRKPTPAPPVALRREPHEPRPARQRTSHPYARPCPAHHHVCPPCPRPCPSHHHVCPPCPRLCPGASFPTPLRSPDVAVHVEIMQWWWWLNAAGSQSLSSLLLEPRRIRISRLVSRPHLFIQIVLVKFLPLPFLKRTLQCLTRAMVVVPLADGKPVIDPFDEALPFRVKRVKFFFGFRRV